MSFDGKRDDLLQKLNTMHREKETKRINQTVKARLKTEDREKDLREQARPQATSLKPKVLIYGTVRLFVGTLKSILTPYCDVVEFDVAAKAEDYIIDNHIPIVFMDMDPPNDWKLCHDLFTTGRTMYPDIEYILFHKDKVAQTQVEILLAQGARELTKPIDQFKLIQLIKEIIKRQETK